MRSLLVLMGWAFVVSLSAGAMPLAGDWRFRMDPGDKGVDEGWFSQTLPDKVGLPGCMQAQGYGDEVTADTKWIGLVRPLRFGEKTLGPYLEAEEAKIPYWLQPEKHYVGAAWYQRDVIIPEDWQGRRITLFLERCHWMTAVWVDGEEAGSQDSLSVPHEYDLSRLLSPGNHVITIRVDNRMVIDVGENAHSISDNTQSSWNGIAGRIELRVSDAVRARIVDCQVYIRT